MTDPELTLERLATKDSGASGEEANNPPPHPQPNTLHPLPGEAGIPHVAAPRTWQVSRKAVLAVGLLVVTVAVGIGMTTHRVLSGFGTARAPAAPLAAQQPTTATAPPRRLDLSEPVPASAVTASAPVAVPSTPRIPALDPAADLAGPIPLRRNSTPTPSGPVPTRPEDAPILLVSSRPGAIALPGSAAPAGTPDALAATRERLDAYQRQLQGLLQNLEKGTQIATGADNGRTGAADNALLATPTPPPATRPATRGAAGLLGGALPTSATPTGTATTLRDRSLTLPKGTAFTCALKTKVISANAGLVGCQVQRNVFSDDGRVLLIERGSHLDGEYRVTNVRPGTTRIPVIWTRVRTPLGVVVDLDSPATGPLGESGLEGYVDNRWPERIGAAMLVSLIDDAVKIVVQNQTQGDDGDVIVLRSSSGNASKLAEKVLDSTINIPPLITQHQGGLVGIYVARDVDFSNVYTLQAEAR